MSSIPFDRHRWMRIARNAAIGLALFLVVVGVGGFFVAPGLVKSVAEKQIGELLGRKATIGAVEINPFRLRAIIRDFTLFEADGTTPAVRVEALLANVSSASLFKRALVLDAIKVTRPQISFARLDPEHYSFSDILDKLAAKPKNADPPPRFSLNNIEVDDGSIAFDDRVTRSKHLVDQLRVGVPFVSDLPYDTDIIVTPAFAARVDGSAVALGGKAQPFADRREATLQFDMEGLDLTRYIGFVPAKLAVQLASGRLDAHLQIVFRAAGKDADGKDMPQSLAISGPIALGDLKLTEPSGREVVSLRRFEIDAERIEPLGGLVAIKHVAIVEPHVSGTRRADGSIDLVTLLAPSTPLASAPPAAAPTKPAPPPVITIASLHLENGRVDFTDLSLATPAGTTLERIDLKLDALALQGDRPTTYALSLATPGEGTIETHGSAVVARRSADGTVTLKHIQPGAFSQNLAAFLAARIDSGTIDATSRYAIDASGPQPAARIQALDARIENLHMRLPNEKSSFVSAEAIALGGAAYDLASHALTADTLTLTAPVVAIARDKQGRMNLQAALVEKKADATTPRAQPAVEIQPADTPPFSAVVRRFAIERADVSLEDRSQATPVSVRAAPLNLKAENVGTVANAMVPFSLDTGVDQRGKLVVEGRFAMSPLSLDASVNASRVAFGWLAAYAGDRLNVIVQDADLNARGTVHVQSRKAHDGGEALTTSYRGSLGVVRMRALDRLTSGEFLRWKTLDIPRVEFDMPARHAPLALTLGKVTLDDLYARVIINANGRLNVQDVVTPAGQQRSVTTPETEAPTVAPAPTPPAPAPGKARSGGGKAASPVAAPARAGPRPAIRVAGIKLTKGRVGFTDNFIKPNYSANLTDLDGEVSALSSTQSRPADLRFGGKIDGDGVLDINGQVDPFADELFVDVAANAKDIELTRLTPYAVKYAGYPIEHGKLSTTVKYHIENGKLEAENRLFLDQLTFGDHDGGSSANLPVRLAVALLKNSKGEIDINLPVSGSLSDPQFSIGAVIFRALVNLVVRAATSPFALLGSAFGGGSGGELGYIQFAPGVSDLTPQGKQKLETLAKALVDRPALKLDIIGRYDPATDPEGIKKDHLLDRLKDAKAKATSKSGERVRREDVTIAPEEYPKYLAQVYGDTKLPNKPRNLIGLAKTIPPEEMERLLLADMKLDPNDPRWLADARADVVRHYLEDQAKVAPSRLFLVTPKLDATGIDDKGVPNRVDFSLR